MMDIKEDLSIYLIEDSIVDFSSPKIQALASSLARGVNSDEDIARHCFLFVRDNINHTGDHKDNITTLKASEVLQHTTGWCYAKSILLAALLRANNIPTGFCYQRLSCGEYKDDVYCLHGLNAIYLKEYGWYRVDARGNKEGIDAQFTPPMEKLAFELQDAESDLEGIYSSPLDEVIEALKYNKTYEDMTNNFPDIKQ
ncbi:transglutaminase family protein [Sulfurimonas sp.]|uniref:transglutaminase-like domain-containing protein n=1 Tax=Sulfurimonas sp. TaxID=2022749 RepID=UPI003562AD36